MPAAARVGDLTAHKSTPLGSGPGSSNVLIGGTPAWRAVVDVHTCPDVDPPNKKHPPGTVLKGSSKVFINKQPAARQGDQVVEPGAASPNSITGGYPKVQIGG
jgi:uncharacterized Zn-binding protein involved in type VI secretion